MSRRLHNNMHGHGLNPGQEKLQKIAKLQNFMVKICSNVAQIVCKRLVNNNFGWIHNHMVMDLDLDQSSH